jgi:hypothetical protein
MNPLARLAFTVAATTPACLFAQGWPIWDWPAPYTAGGFAKVIAGEFSHDPMIDLAVLRGGQVYLVASPEVMACFAAFGSPSGVLDIAAVTAPGIASDRVAALAGGLHLGEFVGGAPQWTAIPDPRWLSVVQLATQPSATGSFVAGLHANRSHVTLAHWSPGTGFQHLATVARSTTSPIESIVLVDWLPDAVPEIAMRQRHGLEVVDTVLGTVAVVAGVPDNPLGCIAAIAAPVSGQRLAWVTPTAAAPAPWVLRIVAPEDPNLQTLPIAFPDTSVTTPITGLAAGNADGDGTSDLLLSQDATATQMLLIGREAWPALPYSTSAPDVLLLPLVGAPGGNACAPILADVNYTRTADLVACRDTGGDHGQVQLQLDLRTQIDDLRGLDPSEDGDYPDILPLGAVARLDYDPVATEYYYRLNLELPGELVGQMIEVTVYYHRVDNPAAAGTVAITSESTFQFAPHGPFTFIEVPVRPGEDPEWHLEDHYYFKIAFPDLGDDGYSPNYLFGLAAIQSETWSSQDVGEYYLQTISDADPASEVSVQGQEPAPPPSTGNRIIGMVKKRKLKPPTPIGSIPTSGTPQEGRSGVHTGSGG